MMGGCSLLGRSAPAQPDEPAPFEAPENSGRFIGAVGSAPQSADESVVLQMADEDARGKLADAVAEYAREVVVEFLATHKGYADPESERARAFESAVSKGAANAILRQDLRAESRRDPRSGRLCVVYRVPVSIVNDKISENARRALSPVSPFERSLEAKAMEELDEFLAATLKERVITASQRPEAEVDREIGNPPPAWLAYGRHQDYPRSTFMVAVGIGDSPEATVESARSDLRNRIAGRIPGLDVDDLLNVKLTASWYDPITDTHYGLGVLDRAQTTARCRERVRKALEEAHALLESAVNHHRADNFLTALRGYVEALANAQTVPKLARAAAVVEPARKAEFAELTKDAPLVEIELKLRELVGMFAMRKAGGDEQWTPPGVALPKPLKVLLTAGPNALPVAGLPLRFSFKAGRGRLQEVVRTDENGTAACPVECVEGNGEPFGAVECALALEELAPTVELPDMTGPAVVFNYVMRARSNTHLALYLVEDPGEVHDRAGDPGCASVVRECLAKVNGRYSAARMVEAVEAQQRAVDLIRRCGHPPIPHPVTPFEPPEGSNVFDFGQLAGAG